MTLKLETLSACPLCAGAQVTHLLTVPDFESRTGDYGIDVCGACGVAFTNPRPLESELPALYAMRTTADFPPLSTGFAQRLRDFAIDRYVEQQLRGVEMPHTFEALDFGCGDGALVRGLARHCAARGKAFRLTAVDFHDAAPPALAGFAGVTYVPHDTWQAARGTYQAIFLRHVLEHHSEPQRLVRDLGGCLVRGGRLFVEVPNRASAWAKIFGKYYAGYYVPRHLMHFDRASLPAAIERGGLRCASVRLAHTPLVGHSLAYRLSRDIGNTSLFGLATYPAQVALDVVAGTSTTLRAVAVNDR